ncbi:MAG: hypothetical protein ABIK25_07190 [Pseudomonadota bacterium]
MKQTVLCVAIASLTFGTSAVFANEAVDYLDSAIQEQSNADLSSWKISTRLKNRTGSPVFLEKKVDEWAISSSANLAETNKELIFVDRQSKTIFLGAAPVGMGKREGTTSAEDRSRNFNETAGRTTQQTPDRDLLADSVAAVNESESWECSTRGSFGHSNRASYGYNICSSNFKKEVQIDAVKKAVGFVFLWNTTNVAVDTDAIRAAIVSAGLDPLKTYPTRPDAEKATVTQKRDQVSDANEVTTVSDLLIPASEVRSVLFSKVTPGDKTFMYNFGRAQSISAKCSYKQDIFSPSQQKLLNGQIQLMLNAKERAGFFSNRTSFEAYVRDMDSFVTSGKNSIKGTVANCDVGAKYVDRVATMITNITGKAVRED